MIVFDLECRSGGHGFEGWFGSSEDFAAQQARGLVTCPQCGSADVGKAAMAPRLARKGNQLPAPAARSSPRLTPPPAVPAPQTLTTAPALAPQAQAMMQALATMQAEALKRSRWVGRRFAEDARAMHYGESDAEPIHGQASLAEARALVEEGIDIAPVLFPLAPPSQVN